MNDWTAGYVSEIEYTHGYYAELNPERVRLALTLAGVEVGEIRSACELGYGQGVGLNMHAAASPVQWWGTDFNPAQAAYAQSLAAAAGTGRCHPDDAGFEEYCRRSDLPKFDFIGLHGIWSWITPANRQAILDLIRSRLNVGGVVYVSYNTQPGWAAFAPMRALLKQHADVMAAPGEGVVQKMDRALAFVEEFLATQPVYARANPSLKVRFEKLKTMNRNYLVHEYFNGNWEPMRFDETAAFLEGVKLTYACSAALLEHVDALNLSPAQQKFLAGIKDPVFKQTVRDYSVNQQFRRDYWVKGARSLPPVAQWERLKTIRVLLSAPAAEFTYKATGGLGAAELQKAVYEPILQELTDYKILSIGQLFERLTGKNVALPSLIQALTVLLGMGCLQVAQRAPAAEAARKSSDALNRHLMDRARSSHGAQYLCSPVIGGGIPCSRIVQLLLLAKNNGAKTEGEMVQAAWRWLSAAGHSLVKQGKTLQTPEENLAQLAEEAAKLMSREYPIFKALGVV